MNKKWSIIEKILGILIVLWGLLAFYSVITMVWKLAHPPHIIQPIPYFDIIKSEHLNLILGLGTIYAGILLLFNTKEGWTLSVIATIMYAISFIISARSNSQNNQQTYFDFFKSYSLMALIFVGILVL